MYKKKFFCKIKKTFCRQKKHSAEQQNSEQLPRNFPNSCYFGGISRKVHANFFAEKKSTFHLKAVFSSDFQENKTTFIETFLEVHYTIQ